MPTRLTVTNPKLLAVLVAIISLGGCALTRVDARPPAAPVGSVAVISMESGFPLPPGVRARLSAVLQSSLGAHGQVVADVADASCHVTATVERVFHHARVDSGPHNTTDFAYDTYRVRLLLLDTRGVQIGSAVVEEDEFPDTAQHPEREEQILAKQIDRATSALFVAPNRELRASR